MMFVYFNLWLPLIGVQQLQASHLKQFFKLDSREDKIAMWKKEMKEREQI